MSEELDEVERLGALYEVAGLQQQAVNEAVRELAKQAEVARRFTDEAFKQKTDVLTALQKGAEKAVEAALEAQASQVATRAQEATEKAAKGFLGAVKTAREDVAAIKADMEAAAATAGRAKWWVFLAVFFAGLACGAAGLYLARPAPVIQLDASQVAAQIAGACRGPLPRTPSPGLR